MRPVVRGKNTKVFKDYRNARKNLIDQLGEYCSYCEMRLGSSLAVEHILPQALFSDEKTNWENFCLACINCNSTKKSPMERRWKDSWQNLHIISAKIAARSEFYWLDQDNTFRAFEYTKGGHIQVHPFLSLEEQKVAQATVEMVGLDKTPKPDMQMKDRRWINRKDAWETAERYRQNLRKCNDEELLKQMQDMIVSHAVDKGFFSV
ncbi:HNH endonuclease [Trichormus sp. NMC-1]|uniref:HNH endonuclease n=1 Tax=Trichormus sp. NMC-1 TaxID=1853259 RepID=UPI0008DC1E33|nr:HNH endonuclease [Trichormus sp. NMC-1]